MYIYIHTYIYTYIYLYIYIYIGLWNVEHQGQSSDCVKGWASGMLAKNFCDSFSLPKMARFNHRAFPPGAPAVLSHAWCHRMQYFFDLWNAHPGPEPFQASAAQLEAYVEPSAFTQLAHLHRSHFHLNRRACQIRALFA